MSQPGLPHLLSVIADKAGMDVALRAAKAFGGQRIYISADPRPNDPLVLVVGLEAARAISEKIGGNAVEFPSGNVAMRRLIAIELEKKGASANQMAVVLKSSYRWARELRKRVLDGRPAKVAHRPRRIVEGQIDLEDYLLKK